jgi:hypothetical protein
MSVAEWVNAVSTTAAAVSTAVATYLSWRNIRVMEEAARSQQQPRIAVDVATSPPDGEVPADTNIDEMLRVAAEFDRKHLKLHNQGLIFLTSTAIFFALFALGIALTVGGGLPIAVSVTISMVIPMLVAGGYAAYADRRRRSALRHLEQAFVGDIRAAIRLNVKTPMMARKVHLKMVGAPGFTPSIIMNMDSLMFLELARHDTQQEAIPERCG